jgi:hypothetical protein
MIIIGKKHAHLNPTPMRSFFTDVFWVFFRHSQTRDVALLDVFLRKLSAEHKVIIKFTLLFIEKQIGYYYYYYYYSFDDLTNKPVHYFLSNLTRKIPFLRVTVALISDQFICVHFCMFSVFWNLTTANTKNGTFYLARAKLQVSLTLLQK